MNSRITQIENSISKNEGDENANNSSIYTSPIKNQTNGAGIANTELTSRRYGLRARSGRSPLSSMNAKIDSASVKRKLSENDAVVGPKKVMKTRVLSDSSYRSGQKKIAANDKENIMPKKSRNHNHISVLLQKQSISKSEDGAVQHQPTQSNPIVTSDSSHRKSEPAQKQPEIPVESPVRSINAAESKNSHQTDFCSSLNVDGEKKLANKSLENDKANESEILSVLKPQNSSDKAIAIHHAESTPGVDSLNPADKVSRRATALQSVCTLDLECFSDYEYESVFDSLMKKKNSHLDMHGQPYEIFQDELGFKVCRAVEFVPEPNLDESLEVDELLKDELLAILDDDENVAEIERYLMDNEEIKSNKDAKSECGSEANAKKYNCFMPAPENHVAKKLMYKQIDLASLSATSLVNYAVNVSKCLFSLEELKNGLIPSLHRQRGKKSENKTYLDENRIKVLKDSILNMFNINDEILNSIWSHLRSLLNGRFTHLKSNS